MHKTSIIDKGAEIGKNCKIWHWVHISSGARLGQNCVLGQNVYVGDNVLIGDNVKVQNNVSIYNSVVIEDDVFCGPSMVFTNVINPRSKINRKDEFKNTLVKKGTTIGANATIICGITLGAYSFIAAGAVVTKDVDDFALMAGVPAKKIGTVNEDGTRNFFK